MDALGKVLVLLGVSLVAVGLLLWLRPSIPILGKLPGDICIERPGFRLYLPVTTCLVLSGILSLVLWLVSKLRG